MSTTNLGNLVVRLALQLAEYKAGWKEAEDVTRDGAAKVDQANKSATQGSDVLKDALKRQAGAYGEAAGGALEYGQAATAATGISTGLAVGLGAVAVALGAVGYAAFQGAKEQHALNNSLLLTGNYAGLVTGQLDQMALSVASSIGGNVGHAREVLAGLVGTGRFTVESLGQVSEAVQLVAQYSGRTNEQVLKDFAGMADGVAKWAAKSNEAYHFLDLATYQYIQSLEEQGKKQEAMKATSEALSAHLGGDMTKNLGYLDRVLKGVTSTWAEFWAAAKGVGKDKGFAEQIGDVDSAIEKAGAGLMGSTAKGQAQVAMLKEYRQKLADLQSVEMIEAQVKSDLAQKSELQIKADERLRKAKEDALTSEERLLAKLKKIREDGALNNWTAKQIADLVAATEAAAAKGGGGRSGPSEAEKALERQRRLLAELSGVTASYMQDLSDLNKMRDAGTLSEEQYVAAVTKLIEKQPMAKALMKAQADETERVAKADIEAGKAREYHLAQLDKGLEKTNAEIEKEQEHTRTLGLSKEAIAELVAAKLEDEAVSLELLAIRKMDKDLDEAIYDGTMRQADALRKLAQAKREGAAKEAFLDMTKKQEQDWDQFVGEIDKTFHDGYMQMLQNGEEGWKAWGHSLVNTFQTTVADEIYKMFAKPMLVNVISSAGSMLGLAGAGGSTAGGGSMSMLNGASSAYNLSRLTAPGGAYYNFATSGFGQSVGLSNAAPIIGNNVSAYAPAGTQLASPAALAPYAAILAPVFAAFADGFFSGEKRGGAQYGYSFDGTSVANARRGTTQSASGVGATFLEGPSGGDPAAEASKLVVNSTVASINATLQALGSKLTLTGYQAAYETSNAGKGGVFAGGAFNNGVSFGESGRGSSDPNAIGEADPNKSLYEMWGVRRDPATGGYTGMDTNGSPEKLALDAAQSFIEAIQASVGIIPKIVAEKFNYTTVAGAEQGTTDTQEGTRYLRVYDDAMKQSVQTLGLLPKKIMDLILDVDPEALSDAATKDLATKIQTLVTNVNGFRAIVDALPVEQLRSATFDIAAGLVELSGGLDAFASNVTSYYDNFYTAEEKRLTTERAISARLATGGLTYSASDIEAMTKAADPKALFRGLVESLDLTTESGRAAYSVLLAVNGEFAALVPTTNALATASEALATAQRSAADIAKERLGLENQLLQLQGNTAELRARELAGLDESNRALQQQIYSLQDATSAQQAAAAAQQATAQAAQQTLDNATSALMQSYSQQSSALQQVIDQNHNYAVSLRAARDAMMLGANSPMSAQQRTSESLHQYNETYAAALGGDLQAIGQLQGAGTAYLAALQQSSPTKSDFNTGFSMIASGLTITAAKADATASIAQSQLTAMTGQLTALGLIKDVTQTGFDALLAAYMTAKAAVNVASGLTTGTSAAGASFNGTDPTSPSAPWNAYAAANGGSGDLYYFMPGVNDYTAKLKAATDSAALVASEGGPAYTTEQAMNIMYGHSMDYWQNVQTMFDAGQHPLATDTTIPGFATGGLPNGMSWVGENGPELADFRTPARIYTAEQSRSMVGGGEGGSETAAEIRKSREEARLLMVEMIARLQGMEAKLKKFDAIGLAARI